MCKRRCREDEEDSALLCQTRGDFANEAHAHSQSLQECHPHLKSMNVAFSTTHLGSRLCAAELCITLRVCIIVRQRHQRPHENTLNLPAQSGYLFISRAPGLPKSSGHGSRSSGAGASPWCGRLMARSGNTGNMGAVHQ